MRFVALVLLLIADITQSRAGGHPTKFDANAYGGPGAVSCLGPALPGICNTGYDAKCAGGSTDDTVAYTNFVTANLGGTAVLYADYGSAFPPQHNAVCNDIAWSSVLAMNNLGT